MSLPRAVQRKPTANPRPPPRKANPAKPPTVNRNPMPREEPPAKGEPERGNSSLMGAGAVFATAAALGIGWVSWKYLKSEAEAARIEEKKKEAEAARIAEEKKKEAEAGRIAADEKNEPKEGNSKTAVQDLIGVFNKSETSTTNTKHRQPVETHLPKEVFNARLTSHADLTGSSVGRVYVMGSTNPKFH